MFSNTSKFASTCGANLFVCRRDFRHLGIRDKKKNWIYERQLSHVQATKACGISVIKYLSYTVILFLE